MHSNRAELLSAPTPLSRARATLAACERIRRKFGDEARVTVEQLEVARNRVKQLEALEASGKSPSRRRIAPERNPVVWLDRPVLVGEHSRVRIVGYDSAVGAPEWLAAHLAEKAAV